MLAQELSLQRRGEGAELRGQSRLGRRVERDQRLGEGSSLERLDAGGGQRVETAEACSFERGDPAATLELAARHAPDRRRDRGEEIAVGFAPGLRGSLDGRAKGRLEQGLSCRPIAASVPATVAERASARYSAPMSS